MLPTPVKTPQKKQIPKSAMAARALFQDQPNANTDSPRKNQKKKVRHNGFSLESFSENTSQDQVQIHIDSRDQIPEVDTSADNPFYVAPESSSKKRSMASAQDVLRSSKRRKVAEERAPLDSQVKDAIEKDEGMVYVFRGTKVYKRFDDTGDEEEVIDPEELGLLVNETDAAEIIKPLKTLTRKSIRPKRLFQTEKQLSQIDEEADTDIEDNQKEIEPEEEQPSPSRTTRSSGAGNKKKRTSPFDSWQRLKPGSRSAGSDSSTKNRKRTAAEALGL
ncbi:hypothetical protein LTS08_000796 [Lithohypha guttulata]|uniref:uncharacterized protein n=1 Tax=Lithohypha guttulata TaxID=1690604 RepID=UPI002DDE37B9|nr:hypothetical protein LTR51_006593 [Lithohypha guttulata]KAK5106675.1 hypothetical protein LTS08_000796 [Lithohypha guttulata]